MSSASGPSCGNGAHDPGESCDDGNFRNGDGCADCAVEDGWTCPETGACVPTCGDNRVLGTEACDDGNALDGDGCSSACALEATCGNHAKEPGEACDEGSGGLGCESTCTLPAGTACGDAPLVSDAAYADGRVHTYEPVPLPPVTFSTDAACRGTSRALPWRYMHRFTVGPRPAALTVEAWDPLLRGVAPLAWVQSDCADAADQVDCGDDLGPALGSRATTPVLPARTVVFVVVAMDGDLAPDGYALRITERPRWTQETVADCSDAPYVDGNVVTGTLDSTTAAASATCTAEGPSAWFRVAVNAFSRVETHAGPGTLAYIVDGACDRAVLGCGPSVAAFMGAGDVLFGVRGITDGGTFQLSVDVEPVAMAGEPCDPAPCADGLACVGPAGSRACTGITDALVNEHFDADLGVLLPAAGWTWDTGHAWLAADAAATQESTLDTPPLDATAAAGLVAWFTQQRVTGTGRVLVGVAGTWTEVARLAGPQDGPVVLDLSPWAAASADVVVRWAASPAEGAWTVDDVVVMPY